MYTHTYIIVHKRIVFLLALYRIFSFRNEKLQVSMETDCD